MKMLKEFEEQIFHDPRVEEKAPYVGFLNLLLFCGTVFVFGFVSQHIESVTVVTEAPTQSSSAEAQPLALPDKLAVLKEELESEYAPITDLKDFFVHTNGNSLEIHFGIGDIFEAGSSDLAGTKFAVISSLARFILPKVEGYKLEFEGHTDDVPVVKNAWKFPTNWELSTARASRVLRVFVANGHVESKMKVSGKSWFEPKAPNRDPAGDPIYENQLRNRRLVLRITKP